MINWKVSSNNSQVSFANAQDFLGEESIPKEIRDSYNQYVIKTNPTSLKKNDKGYYMTEWMEIDSQNHCAYDASYNERFGWSVRKMPETWGKKEDKAATTTATVHVSGETVLEPEPKHVAATKVVLNDNAALNRIVDLLEIVVEYLTDKKGFVPAGDLK